MDPFNRNGWNPLFNPTSQYGGNFAPGAFAQTGAGDYYQSQNPETVWTRRLAGEDPFSARGQNLRGLWSQINEGYNAAVLTNPNLKIQDYVGGLNPDTLYNAQTAAQRGENPGRFAPRARTISRAYGG